MPNADSRSTQIVVALGACALVAAATFALPNPAVMVAIGIVPLLLIVAFQRPFLICLAFIVLSFFRLHEAFPVLNPLHLPQALAIGSLAVLATYLLTKRMEVAWTPPLKFFAIFFGLITFGMFLATGRDIALAYWTDTYVKIAIMVFAIASLAREPRDFGRAMRAFVLAGDLVAYVALYNSAHSIGLVEGTRVTIGRDMGSVLGDPNDLSLVLAFPLSFAASLVLTERTGLISRAYGLASFGMITMAILATQSRGGLLGIVAVCATFAARRVKNKAVLFGGGFLALMVLFAAAGISGRSSGGAAEGGVIDESSEGRLYAWGAAIRMAVAHPLTGVGLNNYVANYYFYSTWWEGFAKAVHSTWFSVLAESGFLGFGIFITMIVTTFRSIFRSVGACGPQSAGELYSADAYGMSQAVLAGMIGFCVSGSFLTQGFTWPVYILVSLGAALQLYVARRDGLPASPASRTEA